MTTSTLQARTSLRGYDIEVQGIRTRVFEVDPDNDLPPLILLHGGGIDSALVSFGAALTSLGQHRRVITPDLPGYGDSEFPHSSFSVPWYCDWVADLIHALALDRVDLGGLSLGGWIALEAAINHPDVVRRLIAINPAGVTETFPFMHAARWVANHPGPVHRIRKSYLSLGRRIARIQLRATVSATNPSALSDDLIDAVIDNGTRKHAGEAFTATLRWALATGPEGWSILSRLPQVKTKTLVIAGRADKIVPVCASIRASQLIPNGEVCVLQPCGHWLVNDRPTEFVQAVNRFLDAV
jgi:pimeloyl-ACP methyl ester carboxylesterase